MMQASIPTTPQALHPTSIDIANGEEFREVISVEMEALSSQYVSSFFSCVEVLPRTIVELRGPFFFITHVSSSTAAVDPPRYPLAFEADSSF
jgi:hypothetical protein